MENTCNNGEYYDHQLLRNKKDLTTASLYIHGLRSRFDDVRSLNRDHRIHSFALK